MKIYNFDDTEGLRKIEKIECKRLSDVLDGCLKKNTKIDLLTIDTEGHDLKVLKSNNWNKYLPDYIVVEISSSTLDEIMNTIIEEHTDDRYTDDDIKRFLNEIYIFELTPIKFKYTPAQLEVIKK